MKGKEEVISAFKEKFDASLRAVKSK